MKMNNNHHTPHILFLFSDTGGGHRSVTEAIIESLHHEFDASFTTEMVDILKQYAPHPFNRLPEVYTQLTKVPRLWGAGYKFTDGRMRARALHASMWPLAYRSAQALVREHPADMVVAVHPVATTLIIRALGRKRPPFITVVTDYITNHALWYDFRSDAILVPTEEARQGAIHLGAPPKKVYAFGMPVASKYCKPIKDKASARRKLGWPDDKFIALLIGGREGMGPLAETAHAIAESALDLCLVIVTGENHKLKASLEAQRWPLPVIIYGFTREMPDFMEAADVIVTKAGAATVTEALNSRLPMLFYGRVPGQEDGNVNYVVSVGAGVWAPTPKLIVQTLSRWIKNPSERLKYVDACRRAARPTAARDISMFIMDMFIKAPIVK